MTIIPLSGPIAPIVQIGRVETNVKLEARVTEVALGIGKPFSGFVATYIWTSGDPNWTATTAVISTSAFASLVCLQNRATEARITVNDVATPWTSTPLQFVAPDPFKNSDLNIWIGGGGASKPFGQKTLIVEAEYFTYRSDVGVGDWYVHNWVPDPGYAGGGVNITGATRGTFIYTVDTGAGTKPPFRHYTAYEIIIETIGSYLFHIRSTGPNLLSDSLFIDIVEIPGYWETTVISQFNQFDGTPGDWNTLGEANVDTGNASCCPMLFNFTTTGRYTLRISAREDGVAVDAFALVHTDLPPLDTNAVAFSYVDSFSGFIDTVQFIDDTTAPLPEAGLPAEVFDVTCSPTPSPTPFPTGNPTDNPTAMPTSKPTPNPTAVPTSKPTPVPTSKPTPNPTGEPTPGPSIGPSPEPTAQPTGQPTVEPSAEPTPAPSVEPTPVPTVTPTSSPTFSPPATPVPTEEPIIMTPEPTSSSTPYLDLTQEDDSPPLVLEDRGSQVRKRIFFKYASKDPSS